MELSVREAATLLGRSARTFRAQLARGEIAGRKRGNRWVVDRHELPLTERQRRVLQARADDLRSAFEEALPAPVRRRKSEHSVHDLETFRIVLALRREMRASPGVGREVVDEFDVALMAVARGQHAFAPPDKLSAFREARDRISSCVVLLVLDDPEGAAWAERLEGNLLPSLSGLIRWAERRRGDRR